MRPPRPGVAVGVAALALVGAGTAVAVVRRAPAPDALRTSAISPSPDVATESPDPVLPTAAPTALPTVVPTAVPSGHPLPVTTGSPRPTAPGAPGPPPPAQTGHWRHTQSGVTMDVRIDPPRPVAGQRVVWTITLDSDGRECCGAQILYGDNQAAGEEQGRYCNGPEPYQHPPGHAVYTFTHGYRRGGTYVPWISAMAGCDQGPVYYQFKPTVVIGAGPLLSNGPFVPWVTVDDSVPYGDDDPSVQWFQGVVTDHDGAPWSWTWHWGDGSPAVEVRNPDKCVWPPDGGWVESWAAPHVSHTFPHPGTYTVSLVAVTAGCDGRDRQTVSASMTWTVEAPQT